MNREPDCIAIFILHSTAESGRASPASSRYRPQHAVHENYQTSATHEYIDKNEVLPGESASAKVWFCTPHVYPYTLWPGRVIKVLEGERPVGVIKIIEVLNPVLAGNENEYQPMWNESFVLEPNTNLTRT